MLLEERSRSVGQVALLAIEQFLLVLEIAHLHSILKRHAFHGKSGVQWRRDKRSSNDRCLLFQQLREGQGFTILFAHLAEKAWCHAMVT
jgi:hypothetical protein